MSYKDVTYPIGCERHTIIIQRGEFKHYGIKGQKWGVRRFQNDDGSLTEEGHERYSQQGWESRQMYKRGI